MAQVSIQEFERLWTENGGDPKAAPVMAALMLQQSNGNPDAVNSSDPGPNGSVGLLQINSAAHPDLFSQYGGAKGLSDAVNNVKAAVQLYNQSGLSPWSTVNAPNGGTMENPIVTAYQQGKDPLAVAQTATLDSATTTPTQPTGSTSTNLSATANVPATTFASPMEGVNVKNFMGSGIDLSAVPANELGNAEIAVRRYITDPGYAQALQQRISQDYGYQDSWAQKIPELNGVLIWAASNLDLSTAAGKNQFQSAVQNTAWWKTTDANQRSWEQVLSTDPAQAHQALGVAQDKVLATANQIGVQLTKTQLDSLANTYAAQTFVQSGSFGSQSGTSQEWLDQHVIDAVTQIKNGTSDLIAQGATPSSAGDLTGIASALYQQFQQVAQQYLMYNPTSPGQSLLKQSDLMAHVNQALQSYTGTGASGQISQFEAGALNNFTEQMKQQASQMYPSLAGAIAQGTTPQQYTQPMANLISNTLGLDPSAIDFTSPTWNWAIATPDAKTNQKVALTQDQILQKVTSPTFQFQGPDGSTMSYADTNGAKQLANGFDQQFAAAFGKSA